MDEKFEINCLLLNGSQRMHMANPLIQQQIHAELHHFQPEKASSHSHVMWETIFV
jgi:hypothetical protein